MGRPKNQRNSGRSKQRPYEGCAVWNFIRGSRGGNTAAANDKSSAAAFSLALKS
jgi:hypothetical protein